MELSVTVSTGIAQQLNGIQSRVSLPRLGKPLRLGKYASGKSLASAAALAPLATQNLSGISH